MNRRRFLRGLGASAATTALLPRPTLAGSLATNLSGPLQLPVQVEGRIPPWLRGALVRNGPGLFQRGDARKGNLLDGDGFVRRWHFGADGPSFHGAFVQTTKFQKEQEAGAFLWPTWATKGPPGTNRGPRAGMHPQGDAGVTVCARDEGYYAFTEVNQPWLLDRDLNTLGYVPLGTERFADAVLAAHWKLDPRARRWVHFGIDYAQELIFFLELGKNNHVHSAQRLTLPRRNYTHDFFLTRNHYILHLQPAFLSGPMFASGLQSFKDALRWRPSQPSLLAIVDRHGNEPSRMVEAPPRWMWHAVNAYEQGSDFVLDFVGYRDPGHFLDPGGYTNAEVAGTTPKVSAPGELYRWVINGERVIEEKLYDGNLEFPAIDNRGICRPTETSFMAWGRPDSVEWRALLRFDHATGEGSRFIFDEPAIVTEPVFVPAPPGERDLVLVEVHEPEPGRHALVVFQADDIHGGPIARLSLDQVLPISFHGMWDPRD